MSTLLLGYLDKDCNFLIPPSLRMAEPFFGGLGLAAPVGDPHFGFVDTEGRWAMKPIANWVGPKADGIALFNIGGQRGQRGVEGGHWGWAGGGRLLCEARWPKAKAAGSGLIPVSDGDKWGFADVDGNLVIPLRFEWAGSFSDGAAVVVENGKDGYLKPDGTFLLEAVDGELWSFGQARGRIKRDGAWFVLSSEGRELSEGYDEIWSHLGGMAKAKRGDKFAMVGLDGQQIGDGWFDEVKGYDAGQAAVRIDDEWFVLDSAGALHGPWPRVTAPSGGYTRIIDDRGIGFFGPSGELPAFYESAGGFINDLAGVKRGGKWTFVDREGQEIAPPRWEDCGSFTDDGLCRTKQGVKWGAIDRSGEIVVEHRYTTLGDFKDGVAPARRVKWDQTISPPPAGVTTMPPGGLKHPAFRRCGQGDDVRVTLGFQPVLDDAQIDRVSSLCVALRDVLDQRAAGGQSFHEGTYWLSNYALSIRLRGLEDPVAAADLLMDEMEALELPIKECTFLLLRDDPEVPAEWDLMHQVKPAAPHPDDTRGPNSFSDFDAYWRAVWDMNGVAPRSENLFYLRIARFDREYNVLFADRLLSLHLPDIRVCMGTVQNPDGYTRRDGPRREQVTGAVVDAMARHFSPERLWVPPFNQAFPPPTPGDHNWDVGVEALEFEGRKGWSFAVDPPKLIQDIGPNIFRYREQELLNALAEVVAGCDLAPVILWQLFGQPLSPNMPHMAGTPAPTAPSYYIFQLWEK